MRYAATGSVFNGPAKPPTTGLASSLAYYQATRREIEAVHHVTIIGGGAVGIELAGEIAFGELACFLRRVCA